MKKLRQILKSLKLNKLNSLLLAAAILMSQVAMPVGALAHTASNQKVTICHSTSSVPNPYVRITVSMSAVDGDNGFDHGRGDHYSLHTGPVFESGFTHQDNWGDIIPPFDTEGNYYDSPQTSRNWNSEGQAVWNNDCHLPTTQGDVEVFPDKPSHPVVLASVTGGRGAGNVAAASGQLEDTGSIAWITSLVGLALLTSLALVTKASKPALSDKQ